jgi:hypothetical protein
MSFEDACAAQHKVRKVQANRGKIHPYRNFILKLAGQGSILDLRRMLSDKVRPAGWSMRPSPDFMICAFGGDLPKGQRVA